MRKGALLLALAFAVSIPTAALAAKKKMSKPAADPAIQAQKDSWALFNDAMHPWAPSTPEPKMKKSKKKKG
jgi:hypothetical protein